MAEQLAEVSPDIGEQLADIERKSAKERISEYAKLEAPLRQAGVKAEADFKKAELETDIAKREAGAKALREQVGLEEKELQAGRERIDRYELPTFKPSQEGLTDYARLGSMVMTLGLMLGRGGKDSGLAAINAMSGVLQGWRQGRKDIYERELKQFDKEFQKIKELRGSIEKDLTRAMQLWPTKRKEAMEAAEAAAYKSGVDSIMASYIRAGKYREALALIKSSKDLTAKAIEQENRIQQAKDREAAADRRHHEAMQQRNKLAEIRAKSKGGAGGPAAGQIERLTQSMSQVSGAIKNVAALPVTTTGTIFGPSNFNSLFTVPLSALNNQMSSETAQMLRTRMVSVARNLASLETGGAATGLVGLTQKIEEGIDISAGTPVLVALDKLAEMRRIVEDSARAAIKSNKYTDSQKDLIRENVKIVEDAIPFTQQDVLDSFKAGKGILSKVPIKDKNISFTDYVNTYGLGNTKKPLTPAPAAPVSGKSVATPSTEKPISQSNSDLRSKAAARIAAGADKNDVAARFKELTGEDY